MSKKGQITTTTYMDWNDFISVITRLEKDEDYKFCLLIAIGVFTGLRISDLLTLKYSDLLSGETFSINEMKTKKTRSIKINKDLKEIVERIVKKTKTTNLSELIFVNKYGSLFSLCDPYIKHPCLITKLSNTSSCLQINGISERLFSSIISFST